MKKQRTFNDRHGREWIVAVDLPLLRAVRGQLGFNLLDAIDSKPQLLADPVAVVDVAYLACRAQADAAGLDDLQFGELFDGETVDAASMSLGLAIADWLPAERGNNVRASLVKAKESQDLIVAEVGRRIAAL